MIKKVEGYCKTKELFELFCNMLYIGERKKINEHKLMLLVQKLSKQLVQCELQISRGESHNAGHALVVYLEKKGNTAHKATQHEYKDNVLSLFKYTKSKLNYDQLLELVKSMISKTEVKQDLSNENEPTVTFPTGEQVNIDPERLLNISLAGKPSESLQSKIVSFLKYVPEMKKNKLELRKTFMAGRVYWYLQKIGNTITQETRLEYKENVKVKKVCSADSNAATISEKDMIDLCSSLVAFFEKSKQENQAQFSLFDAQKQDNQPLPKPTKKSPPLPKKHITAYDNSTQDTKGLHEVRVTVYSHEAIELLNMNPEWGASTKVEDNIYSLLVNPQIWDISELVSYLNDFLPD